MDQVSDFWLGMVCGAILMWVINSLLLTVLWATFRYLFQPMKMGRKT